MEMETSHNIALLLNRGNVVEHLSIIKNDQDTSVNIFIFITFSLLVRTR